MPYFCYYLGTSVSIVLNKHNMALSLKEKKSFSIHKQQFLLLVLASVFGSNLQSDRNVPAGDDFVKIDVNSFPVLTLHKERNSKLSPSHTYKHTHTHTN